MSSGGATDAPVKLHSTEHDKRLEGRKDGKCLRKGREREHNEFTTAEEKSRFHIGTRGNDEAPSSGLANEDHVKVGRDYKSRDDQFTTT